MGRQDDLERIRQIRHDQPHLEEIADLNPPPSVSSRPVPRSASRRTRSRRFSTWMMMLVGFGLAVIFSNHIPSLQFLPWNGEFWNPRVLFTSASRVDQTEPQVGDRILDFTVTQGWNPDHMGVDVAFPGGKDTTGVSLYAIGETGADVEVICWYEALTGLNVSTYSEPMDFAFDYSHLNACATNPGERITVKAGQKIAEVGNSGVSTTGPHLHFQQRQNGTASPVTGTHVPGWRGYIELSLSGETLSPSGGIEEPDWVESQPLITPGADSSISPDVTSPEAPYPSPQFNEPQPPDSFEPGLMSPNSSVEPPVPTPPSSSPRIWQSPQYPPI